MDMTRQQLYNTPEFKNHLISLLIVIVSGFILTALLILFLSASANRISEEWIFAVAARIERHYPDSFQEVVPLLTGKAGSEDVNRGKTLLAPFGYVPGTALRDFFARLTFPAIIGFILTALLTLCLNLAVYFRKQKKLFEKLNSLSRTILSILDGRIVYFKNECNEGILDILIGRFNQMVKKMQAAAEHLAREKIFLRNIISDISHQLKTPMASLIMYNDLLLRDKDMKRSTQTDFLRSCGMQLKRMEWLVISLLKLARLETGSISFDKQKTHIQKAVTRAVSALAHLKENRKIKVFDNCVNDEPVIIDENWMTEAMVNILKNAIHHTDPGTGEILFTIKKTALFLRVSIKDNGPGISESDRPHIFERFYKGGNSVEMESVGIGLSLSKIIIEAHGGDLRLSSKSDPGAEFIITLPY